MELAIALVSFATAILSLIEAWKSKKLANEAITINKGSLIKIKELEQTIISQNIKHGGITASGINAYGNGRDGVHIRHN